MKRNGQFWLRRVLVLLMVLSGLLLVACGGSGSQARPVDTSAPAVAAAYGALPMVENAAGVKLRVGMSVAAFEARTGVALEVGWLTTVRQADVIAISADGVVISLDVWGEWHTEDALASGSTQEEVRAAWGAPDEEFAIPPENPSMGWLTYRVGAQQEVRFVHRGDGVVSHIFCAAAVETETPMKGYENAQATGSGEQTLEEFSSYNLAGEYLLVAYGGKGVFELTATGADGQEQVLVSERGPYEGRVDAPGFAPYGLRINAKGDWSILARADEPMQGPRNAP